MFPLFESIALLNGEIQNREWHQWRFEKSYKTFYHENPNYDLLENVVLDESQSDGFFKLRISYNRKATKVEISPYEPKKIQSLQVVHHNTIDYKLKYQDRAEIIQLYERRRHSDDVLIVKNNLITDSSYANIIFSDGDNWYTPNQPLLEGTARARLIKAGLILETEISLEDLKKYKSFKLINALRSFDEIEEVEIENIVI